jgi:hypothetical protein
MTEVIFSLVFRQICFQKIPKLKIYYAKWTLRIEVVNGIFFICYCIFGVYFVTVTKNPDIPKKEHSRFHFFLYHHLSSRNIRFLPRIPSVQLRFNPGTRRKEHNPSINRDEPQWGK